MWAFLPVNLTAFSGPTLGGHSFFLITAENTEIIFLRGLHHIKAHWQCRLAMLGVIKRKYAQK
jgi:hypothetical protein